MDIDARAILPAGFGLVVCHVLLLHIRCSMSAARSEICTACRTAGDSQVRSLLEGQSDRSLRGPIRKCTRSYGFTVRLLETFSDPLEQYRSEGNRIVTIEPGGGRKAAKDHGVAQAQNSFCRRSVSGPVLASRTATSQGHGLDPSVAPG